MAVARSQGFKRAAIDDQQDFAAHATGHGHALRIGRSTRSTSPDCGGHERNQSRQFHTLQPSASGKHQSRKLLNDSGASGFLFSKAIVVCRSSRLPPVTRTVSPWMAACTLILLSLMIFESFGQIGLNASLEGQDLLDLVAADLLNLADVEEANVHAALGELVERMSRT